MAINGKYWIKMLAFCGQDKVLLDANGRIKLSPRFLNDFFARGNGELVMHCLPEKAVALYPEDIYMEMRRMDLKPAEKAAESMVFRRHMRYFGAMTQSQKISQQGRITIPPLFREFAELFPAEELVLVGVEIGLEIWNSERWANELDKITMHNSEKGEREMAEDLIRQQITK